MNRLPLLERRVALASLLSSLFLLAGCERGGSEAGTSFETTSAERVAVLPQMSEALDVAHIGTRRVELFDHSVEPARWLAYREQIASDGEGSFALEPLETLTDVAGGKQTFELMQRQRAKFLVRYRDFTVRDQALFLRNYALHDRGASESVAGRACSLFGVERLDGSRSYELAVDDETGLVLSVHERDAQGRSLSRVVYETLELRPDLSKIVFHRSTLDEVEHVLDRPLAEIFETAVLAPRLLPAGYELREATTLTDDQGERWAKLVYTDGVETLFFAQLLPRLPQTGGATEAPSMLQADELVVVEKSPVTMASGRIGAHRLVVAGKVDARELLDLVNSAL